MTRLDYPTQPKEGWVGHPAMTGQLTKAQKEAIDACDAQLCSRLGRSNNWGIKEQIEATIVGYWPGFGCHKPL